VLLSISSRAHDELPGLAGGVAWSAQGDGDMHASRGGAPAGKRNGSAGPAEGPCSPPAKRAHGKYFPRARAACAAPYINASKEDLSDPPSPLPPVVFKPPAVRTIQIQIHARVLRQEL